LGLIDALRWSGDHRMRKWGAVRRVDRLIQVLQLQVGAEKWSPDART
jgi:hypothetical protein